jgi:hypothetical protein
MFIFLPKLQATILEQWLDFTHSRSQDNLARFTHPNCRLMRGLETMNETIAVAIWDLRDEVLASLRCPTRHAKGRTNGWDHTAIAVWCRSIGADEGVDEVENASVFVVTTFVACRLCKLGICATSKSC